MEHTYSESFYLPYEDVSLSSAREVVPVVRELVPTQSVVDVGCGLGTWLRAFAQSGVEDVFGIDGDYVKPELLHIPREKFRSHDLTKPLELGRRFDLVVSLEVAEHLPAADAHAFVRTLCGLGPVVMFSAAIPFQGGTHHVNEQWPEYWAELFAEQGYVVVDAIRPRIWDNERVAYYYAQNTLLFVAGDRLAAYPALQEAYDRIAPGTLSRVHPRKWMEASDPRQQSLRKVLVSLPFAIRNTFAHRGRLIREWSSR